MMLIFLSVLLVYESRSEIIQISSLGIGQNCGATNIYQITSVDISPWPPSPGQKAQVVMMGLFVAPVYVNGFLLGLCLDNSEWEYDSIYVGVNFAANDVEYFYADVTWPTTAGSYELVMALTSNTNICCWQVNFELS